MFDRIVFAACRWHKVCFVHSRQLWLYTRDIMPYIIATADDDAAGAVEAARAEKLLTLLVLKLPLLLLLLLLLLRLLMLSMLLLLRRCCCRCCCCCCCCCRSVQSEKIQTMPLKNSRHQFPPRLAMCICMLRQPTLTKDEQGGETMTLTTPCSSSSV